MVSLAANIAAFLFLLFIGVCALGLVCSLFGWGVIYLGTLFERPSKPAPQQPMDFDCHWCNEMHPKDEECSAYAARIRSRRTAETGPGLSSYPPS